MPVISLPPPSESINTLLREAGLKSKDSKDLKKILDQNGLSIEELVDQLGSFIRCEDGATKMRGIEFAAKLHGLGQDAAAPIPIVNIIIKDSDGKSLEGYNPILFPR